MDGAPKKELSEDRIRAFANLEKNQKLSEVVFDYFNYQIEKTSKIPGKIIIPHEEFRRNIFASLEELLIQTSYITDPKERERKIDRIYRWYKEKLRFYYSIANMRTKSYFEPNEKVVVQKEEEKKDNIEEVDPLKRSQKNNLISFQEYTVKKINKNKNETTGFNISANNPGSNLTKSTFYSSKDGSKFFSKPKLIKKAFLSTEKKTSEDVLPIHEIKSSYSFNKPKYDPQTLSLEKSIIEEKARQIKMKKSEELIKQELNNFGHKRANFKQNVSKNQEIKKVISIFSKKNRAAKEKQPVTLKIPKQLSTKEIIEIPKQTDEVIQKFLRGNRQRANSLWVTSFEKERSIYIPKTDLSKPKNVDALDKSIDNLFEKQKEYSINFKLPHSKSQKYIKEYNLSKEEIPSDFVGYTMNYDSLFKKRVLNRDFLKLGKSFKRRKEFLSSLSFIPKNDKSLEENLKSMSLSRSTCYDTIKESYQKFKDDFLSFRKSISTFSPNMLRKIKMRSPAIKKAFYSPFEGQYTNSYLPKSFSCGLLSRPSEN